VRYGSNPLRRTRDQIGVHPEQTRQGVRSYRQIMARRIVSDTLHVTLLDCGDSIQISGTEREHVELVLSQRLLLGGRVVDRPRQSGSMWIASYRRVYIPADELQVENFGHRFYVRSRSLERVRTKVAELTESGARLDGEFFRIDEFYTAVCYVPSHAPSAVK